MRTITAEDLKARLDSGEDIVVLDSRRERSYAEGHLPGALSAASEDVKELAPRLVPDRDATVVTYCGSERCRRSARAAERLEEVGFTNVFEYEGGVEDWRTKGYPLE